MQARTGNIIGALGFAALSLWVLWQSAALNEKAALFPQIAGALILIGAAATLLRALLTREQNTEPLFTGIDWRAIAFVVAAFAAALFLLDRLGFPLVATLFFFAVLRLLDHGTPGPRHLAVQAAVAVGFAAVVTGLFIRVLGVSLPLGLAQF